MDCHSLLQGILLTPKIEPVSPALQARSFPLFQDTRGSLIANKQEAKSSHDGPWLLEQILSLLEDH